MAKRVAQSKAETSTPAPVVRRSTVDTFDPLDDVDLVIDVGALRRAAPVEAPADAHRMACRVLAQIAQAMIAGEYSEALRGRLQRWETDTTAKKKSPMRSEAAVEYIAIMAAFEMATKLGVPLRTALDHYGRQSVRFTPAQEKRALAAWSRRGRSAQSRAEAGATLDDARGKWVEIAAVIKEVTKTTVNDQTLSTYWKNRPRKARG